MNQRLKTNCQLWKANNSMKEPIQSAEAVVAAMEGVYDEIPPEIDPDGDPLYRVAFRTDQGVKIFWINSYDYYALKVGMKGLLRWQGKTMLSFGDIIHGSFDMNQPAI